MKAWWWVVSVVVGGFRMFLGWIVIPWMRLHRWLQMHECRLTMEINGWSTDTGDYDEEDQNQ